MTGDSSNQRIIEINYIPSSSPYFKPYLQIDGFKCSSRTSSLQTLNFTVDAGGVFADYYEYEHPTLFPSDLSWREEYYGKTHGSISFSPAQHDVHCVIMYRWMKREIKDIFIALGPYLDQENIYRREPWIDVFISNDELPISDVWESYLPSGSRYRRRQDVNSGATAALNDSTSVTVTVKKIWDDPAYYHIVLGENDDQTGATWGELTDDAQSEVEGADDNGRPDSDEDMLSSEYKSDEDL
ncbi:hypothetical protein K435DRAFT_851305 [Dendrothele bispora CBS 962.96]|uniref:Uncharacterized protein n=1 Tax=Dendrothele bispora (strain CBS 962.96) TaxID=1314807 RepID=A0A4S8MN40_DENBC|nr:hypothetical protein K435DRAFT_851305 [Dendrothele bispora CBS 962.96]